MRLEWGILFMPPSIWMGIIFTSKVYQWDIFFTKMYMNGLNLKICIWMGTIFAMGVYEWVCFSASPSIWMGWAPGTPAAHPYSKTRQVAPRGLQPQELPLLWQECNALFSCSQHWISISLYLEKNQNKFEFSWWRNRTVKHMLKTVHLNTITRCRSFNVHELKASQRN